MHAPASQVDQIHAGRLGGLDASLWVARPLSQGDHDDRMCARTAFVHVCGGDAAVRCSLIDLLSQFLLRLYQHRLQALGCVFAKHTRQGEFLLEENDEEE